MGQALQSIFAQQPQQQAPPAQDSGGVGGFIKSNLPLIGGVAGGLLAAPFTGGLSLIPALALGGAAAAGGAALGEAGKEKISGQSLNAKEIGKQALLSGAGEVVGGGLGRIAGALGKGALKVGSETAEQVAAREGGNILQKSGKALRSGVTNASVKASPFAAEEEARLATVASSKLGLKGSAASQYTQLGSKFKDLSSEIGAQLAKSPAKVVKDDLITAINSHLENSFAQIDDRAANTITTNLEKIAGKDGKIGIQELFKYKQSLGNTLARAFSKLDNPAAVLTAKEETALGAWKGISSAISKAEPSVAAATQLQADIFDLSPGLAKARSSTIGIPALGLQSKTLGNGLGAGKDAAGRVLTATGNALENPTIKSGLNKAFYQQLPRTLTASPTQMPTDPSQALIPSQQSGLSSMQDEQADSEPSIGGYTRSQLEQAASWDVMNNGGKQLAQIKSLLDMLPASPKNTKLSDTAIKTVNDYQSAINELGTLQNTLTQNQHATGPLSSILAINPYDTTRKSVQATIDTARQIVGKALEGGVLRKEDEDKYTKILPTINDTPAVAKAKITSIMQQLYQNLSGYSQLQNTRGAGVFQMPTDPSQALDQ